MNKIKAWKPVIDKFQSKLSTWKSRNLSFGGRMTLAKAVLGNIPTYLFSLFVVPSGVIHELEKIQRRFIWKGSVEKRCINWVFWEKIKAPKKMNGLGLGSLSSLNIALLTKWLWKLKAAPATLWARVVTALHRIEVDSMSKFALKSLPGVWSNIARTANSLSKIGIPLQEVMYKPAMSDSWSSTYAIDGDFNVSMFRERIDRAHHPIPGGEFTWLKVIPKKVACFVWRARMGRIPTVLELSKRDITVNSTLCTLCGAQEETADHILCSCTVAKDTWSGIASWCEIVGLPPNSIREALDFAKRWGNCPRKKKVLQAVIYGVFWILWKERNERIFQKRKPQSAMIIDRIKTELYGWMKYRLEKRSLDWRIWCLNPLSGGYNDVFSFSISCFKPVLSCGL